MSRDGSQYSVIAPYYDRFCGADPEKWARYYEKLLLRHGVKPGALLLDLACGTGAVTAALSRRGFDMTGVDISAEMLAVARETAAAAGQDILLLQQDMTAFELYGTVDAAVCTLDSLNYLKNTAALDKCFALLHNYVIPGGIVAFDLNTRYKFARLYGDNAYVFEDADATLVWQNHFDRRRRRCDFYLSLFEEQEDGAYLRYDETQREYLYTDREIKAAAKRAGFEFLSSYGELSFKATRKNSPRIHYVLKRI